MNSVRDTINKVRETITNCAMIDPGDLLIVAVSGGADSVCLLDILHELRDEFRIKLMVAHYDHGLRQAEDEPETQFVDHLAASMALPFETEKGALLKAGSTASMEEKAREARYRFLERLKTRFNAQKIATGHSLNDQAETVLMRFLRGSGPSGLAGIPPLRDDVIIRPLIEVKREEVESYLEARGLTYVTDSSNFEIRYLRNKIRLELLPLLLDYQPRLVEHLGQLSTILRDENDYLEREARNWVKKEAELTAEEEILVPVSSFIKLPQPVRNRVTRSLLMKIRKNLRRIDQGHIKSVYRLALNKNPQGMINLPDGLTVKKTYDRLAFTIGAKPKSRDFSYSLEGPGTLFLERISRSISLVEIKGGVDFKLGDSTRTAYLDADKLLYPLIVRNFRPGDRFIPLGMEGHKKIKDFFIDLKIPSGTRSLIPILMSQGTPVWVCGYRIDERFKVTPETKKILEVTIA